MPISYFYTVRCELVSAKNRVALIITREAETPVENTQVDHGTEKMI